ncbi:Bifunctional protein GlmU [Methylobacterium crusticola]|uniref:Bifunctional protein GlmU n=1 Tax=Methylobacterium crusticola TaxID=1697972 RepID=A0ABQ4R7D7_9HYPH|nr:LpxA family transferase [Methylobacterium crusticola]GJD53633.1 Bifunctional protein GlmU [Methylobacterium crusticola]
MSLIAAHVRDFPHSALAEFAAHAPWALTDAAGAVVQRLLGRLDGAYRVSGSVAVHATATIESGATLKGPVVVGPGCFVAAGAYLRGGAWLEADCVVGPGAELKSSFVLAGTTLAHFNFVGDSIVGQGVNLEAGAIIANCRNEWPGAPVAFIHEGERIETGLVKFGALVGDRVRIGANAVVAPGAILPAGTVVPRLALVDRGVAPGRPGEAGPA